jgi:hypothetical protein
MIVNKVKSIIAVIKARKKILCQLCAPNKVRKKPPIVPAAKPKILKFLFMAGV